MKKENGYIDLDDFLINKGASSLDVSDLDYEEKIKVEYWLGDNRLAFWIQDDHKKFLFKTVSNPIQAYLELVCEQIAKQLELPCAHYEIAIFQNNLGVISENFKKENAIYQSGTTLLTEYYHLIDDGKQVLPYNNLTDIETMLYHKLEGTPNQELLFQKLKEQLLSIFIYDMITNQADRKSNNWGIEILNNDINLQILFDNQESFGLTTLDDNYSLFVSRDNYYQTNTKEEIVQDFLSLDSNYYPRLLIEWFNKVNIDKVFQDILKEKELIIPTDIQNIIKDSFYQNKEMIDTVIKNYQNVKEEDEHYERKNR